MRLIYLFFQIANFNDSHMDLVCYLIMSSYEIFWDILCFYHLLELLNCGSHKITKLLHFVLIACTCTFCPWLLMTCLIWAKTIDTMISYTKMLTIKYFLTKYLLVINIHYFNNSKNYISELTKEQ